jgi:DNA recombination protein RmuC
MIEIAYIVAGLVLGLGAAAVVALILRGRDTIQAEDPQLAELARLQSETSGRVQAMGDLLAARQAELARAVNERLDAVTQNLGQSMQTTTKHTTEHLQQLHARLAVIDSAQKNITDLASSVNSLQKVFDNKQRRGAFGQGRMEAIVQDGLPKGAYEFQFTLSNRSRPDCCVMMPDKRPLIIDAKFPLESITAIERATTDDERTVAGRQVRQDLGKHIADIAGKYLIPGETQDLALMFVPSESV